MRNYAKDWDKKQQAGDDGKGKSIASMTPEDEAKIDKALKDAGYTDPLARKNMMDELKNKTEPKDRDKKYERWLKADPAKIESENKKKAEAQRKKEGGGDGGKKRKGEPGADDDDSTSTKKSPYPYWILGLLLIPLLFALAARGGNVTMPTGRFPMSLPSLPPLGGPWATGPWGRPWGTSEVVTATGPEINTGLPTMPRRKTTKSVSSPRLVPRSGNAGPSININNVNAQGENIPIDISSGSSEPAYDTVIEETLVEELPVIRETVVEEIIGMPNEPVVEKQTVIVEERIGQGYGFQGPSDPDRLMWMLVAAGIISIPLLLDMTAGWPLRNSPNIEYMSDALHWVVLLSAAAAVYLKLDQTYHWSSRHGRPMVRSTRHIPGYVTPVVMSAAQGTENLIWSVGKSHPRSAMT